MSFFTKRKPKSTEPLPTVPASVIGRLEVEAAHMARAAFRIRNVITDMPGVALYLGQTLLPRVAPMCISQQFDKAVGIVASDPVVGVAATAMVESMKSTILNEKARNA